MMFFTVKTMNKGNKKLKNVYRQSRTALIRYKFQPPRLATLNASDEVNYSVSLCLF